VDLLDQQEEEALEQPAGLVLLVGQVRLDQLEILDQLETPGQLETLGQLEMPDQLETLGQLEMPDRLDLKGQLGQLEY
jgi:hypothetical protein